MKDNERKLTIEYDASEEAPDLIDRRAIMRQLAERNCKRMDAFELLEIFMNAPTANAKGAESNV